MNVMLLYDNTEFSSSVLWVGQQALSCHDPTFLPFHKVSFAHFNFWHDVATTAMFDMLLLVYVLLLLRSLICCYYDVWYLLLLWFADTILMFDAVAMSFISRLFFFIQRFWDFNKIIFKRRIIRIYQICLELLNWYRCTGKEYHTFQCLVQWNISELCDQKVLFSHKIFRPVTSWIQWIHFKQYLHWEAGC